MKVMGVELEIRRKKNETFMVKKKIGSHEIEVIDLGEKKENWTKKKPEN